MLRASVLAVLVFALLATPAVAHHGKAQGYKARNAAIIMHVFGPRYGPQAVRVSECEAGLTVNAHNGQYLGLFQMGAWARSKYGHHRSSPWKQALYAYRYFVESGRDWSPWGCKPW